MSQSCNVINIKKKVDDIIALVIVFLSSIILLIITLMLTITTYKFRWLRKSYNYIVLTLFWSDVTSSIFLSTSRLILTLCDQFHIINCTIIISFTRYFGLVSLTMLCFLTIERYLKIVNHKKYHKLLNIKKTKIIILCVMIISALVVVLFDTNWKNLLDNNFINKKLRYCSYSFTLNPIYGLIILVLTQFSTIVIIIVFNVMLIKYISNFNKKFVLIIQNKNNKKLEKRKAEITISISAVSLSLCYFIFVIPINILDMISYSNQIKVTNKVVITKFAIEICIYLVLLYPAVEGLLFVFTNPQYSKSIKKLLKLSKNKTETINLNQNQAFFSQDPTNNYGNNSK